MVEPWELVGEICSALCIHTHKMHIQVDDQLIHTHPMHDGRHDQAGQTIMPYIKITCHLTDCTATFPLQMNVITSRINLTQLCCYDYCAFRGDPL